ncbi:MAG TPA: hypothetical protein VNZ48_04565 [Xanthobacteraceae bacterium]|nr:hypothetical protein [Xanthobacteraceae bacterium]
MDEVSLSALHEAGHHDGKAHTSCNAKNADKRLADAVSDVRPGNLKKETHLGRLCLWYPLTKLAKRGRLSPTTSRYYIFPADCRGALFSTEIAQFKAKWLKTRSSGAKPAFASCPAARASPNVDDFSI